MRDDRELYEEICVHCGEIFDRDDAVTDPLGGPCLCCSAECAVERMEIDNLQRRFER